MTYKEIHEPYAAAPFRPFEIVLTNGSTIYVGHPEFMMFSTDHRTVYTADERDGSTKRIDIKLLTELNKGRNDARPRKRKR
jgi:hypothetical protein